MSGMVIIGGGPSGLSTARAYRDAGGEGEVTILTPETDSPYARPALSKGFLRGEAEAGDIGLEDDDFYADKSIAVRHEVTVEAIDTDRRELSLAGGETLGYETCVLATGSEPKRLPVHGADDPGIFLLRSLESARTLRKHAEGANSAAVVGTGFIGCEASASLAMRGLRVTLISDEHVPHLARLGEDAGRRISNWLVELGVSLQLGAGVESFDAGSVHVPGNPPVQADLVLCAVGVGPRGQLGEAAGLAMENGRVLTDEYMRASADGVYAVGDVALALNAAAGRRLHVEHWGEALNHGKSAGRTAAGDPTPWAAAPGFFSTIGEQSLKHVAWGDGYDEARFVDHPGDAWTVYYGKDGVTVGVLTHNADEDYQAGRELVEKGKPLP